MPCRPCLMRVEERGSLNAAGKVLNLFIDASIPDDAPFAVVKEQAFSLPGAERFPLVMNYMRSIAFDKTASEWSYYGKLSHAFKRNLRHERVHAGCQSRADQRQNHRHA